MCETRGEPKLRVETIQDVGSAVDGRDSSFAGAARHLANAHRFPRFLLHDLTYAKTDLLKKDQVGFNNVLPAF